VQPKLVYKQGNWQSDTWDDITAYPAYRFRDRAIVVIPSPDRSFFELKHDFGVQIPESVAQSIANKLEIFWQ
jgi:hypothetical protein